MELGYLSNRQDERVLVDPKHHEKVARSVLRAADAFFERKERLSRS
jgi:N-acetylmuramoyl-L-alanine amidase